MTFLDTDILSLLLSGHERVVNRVAACDDDLAIPIVCRIEVLRGRFDAVLKAADGAHAREAVLRLATTERALTAFPIASFDEAAATQLDSLRSNRKLKKVGLADLMIASILLAQKARLITRNVRDFSLVPGLRTENWAD